MSKKTIIIAALFLYIIIIGAGVAAYFVISNQPPKETAEKKEVVTAEQTSEPQVKEETPEEKIPPKPEEPKEAQPSVEDEIDKLTATMEEKVRGGVTYYTYPYPDKPESGVYLRPFVAVGKETALLKNDVYYYYSIDDAVASAWIFGDHLYIEADGYTADIYLDPEYMRKRMAQDATWLSENHVRNADENTVQALEKIGSATRAVITYYKAGGNSRSQELSREDKRRIKNMVALYRDFQKTWE